MSDFDDLRAEVTLLRGEVGELRVDVDLARMLAGGADRDATGVRGSLKAIVLAQNAMRETQLEQGKTLIELSAAVGGLVEGQARHEVLLERLTTGQAEILRRLPGGQPG